MTFRMFDREGLKLRYRDVGNGPCVFVLHGLGGAESQIAEIFPQDLTVRRLTLECRGQGDSQLGPVTALSIATFADDVRALAQSCGIAGAVVGGISMGAAIGLRLAVRNPEFVRALILARPAWLTEPAPENLRSYALVADLLSGYPPPEARQRFDRGELAACLAREAPGNLATMRRFFETAQPQVLAALLRAIAADGPGVSQAEIAAIRVPTLVIGHHIDIAHPLDLAMRLAKLIPTATFVEITPKARNREHYAADFQAALSRFIGGL